MKLSKSKLALAKVINENGEWPQDSEWAVQNGEHGRIGFSINKPVRHDGKSWMTNGGFNFKIEVCKPLKNWHLNVLSREEYYQAYPKADADGWIEWKGGMKSPAESGVPVDVKTKDGNEHYDQLLGDACWHNNWGDANIIAYRPHKPWMDKSSAVCDGETKEELDAHGRDNLGSPVARCLLASDGRINTGSFSTAKPTIEQLAADYRNAKGYADRKQDEADKASMESDAALSQLEDAIAAIGFVITPLAATVKEPELVAAVKVGDEVECVESNIKRGTYNGMVGRLRTIDEIDTSTPYLVDFGEAKV